ncbi:CHASE domain-containing protein [Litorilituus lipolyticus]|nr:CHASE domain-containing protein [Litorilituus lipolyticus]
MTPFSFVNYVGPAAGVASCLIIIWGNAAFVAILLMSIAFPIFSYHYLNLDVDVSLVLISTLAIILQSYWAKQLTYQYVFYKKWLKSRRWLFAFLIKVGPIAGLVSASAVLIISMLDNKVLTGSFVYTFLSSWSSSLLIAVFFVPTMLLRQERDSMVFHVSKKLYILFASFIGAFAILLIIKTSQDEQQLDRLMLFEQEKAEIARVIQQEIQEVEKQVNSLSAFFQASEVVDLYEFNIFSEKVLGEQTSIRALEWAPIVEASERKSFEDNASDLLQHHFVIKERNKGNNLQPAAERERYAPLYYIYPSEGNEVVLGLDVYSNPVNTLSMTSVFHSDVLLASAPISLIQDDHTKPGVLFSKAVFEHRAQENTQPILNYKLPKKQDDLLGFVVAVVQFDDFLRQIDEEKQNIVKFTIQDVSSSEPYVLFGKALDLENRLRRRVEIPVLSRYWSLEVAESEPWFVQDKSLKTWSILLGGTFGGFFFQLMILMMAAYSSELTQQVDSKARALILAKEHSEQSSSAKIRFLRTLNDEIRLPLNAIRAFVEQFKQKGINNKQVLGINHASNNIEQLLNTMMDLSEIESGGISVKSEPFDFYGFINRLELMVKANNLMAGKSIFFLIDKEVPHYINSDELRIQKLLTAFIKSAQQLFKTDSLRLSIKVHTHHKRSATLFFIFSHQDEATAADSDEILRSLAKKDLAGYSTSMAMVKEVSQLLQGNVNLGMLNSGGGMLSASIRVTISSDEEQRIHQADSFDQNSADE